VYGHVSRIEACIAQGRLHAGGFAASVPAMLEQADDAGGRFLTDYLAEGRRLGLLEELLAVYVHLFTETLDGRNAYTTDGIQGLGRPPGTFADYAQRTAGTGVWQVAA
jgi:hypothetical protein